MDFQMKVTAGFFSPLTELDKDNSKIYMKQWRANNSQDISVKEEQKDM